MKLNKLNATYPEFTKYLLDQQKQSSSSHASSAPNNFLYYNSRTRSIEGVSMVSSFTLHKVSATKSLTLLTVSPQLAPTATTPNNINFKPSASLLSPPQPKIFYLPLPYSTSTPSTSSLVSNPYLHQSKASLLPFFHQFIYTIKVMNNNADENLADRLNEPSIEASRMRASLVRSVCSQLDMSPTSLRFNWIEMLKSNRFESNDDEQEVTSSEDYYDNNNTNSTSNDDDDDDNEPEFITEHVR